MRFFFLRILLPLLLFLLLRTMLKTVFAGMGSQTARRPGNPPPPTVSTGGDLKKDPVCGAYVSPAASVTSKIKGELVHFCSEECRDKYGVPS
jgi:YHS domain-containing protein